MSGKGIYNICTGNSNLTLKQGIIVIVYFRWSISFHLRVYRHFYRFRIFFFTIFNVYCTGHLLVEYNEEEDTYNGIFSENIGVI